MTTINPDVQNTTLGTTSAIAYTPPTGFNAWIDGLTIANTSGATVTGITLWRGANITAATAVPSKSLTANQTYPVKELIGHWLMDGTSLYAQAGTAGVIALVLSVRLFPIPE